MISKTRFIHLMRCPRYVALEQIHRYKNDAVVTFDDIISEENKEKIKPLVEFMYDDQGEDLIDREDIQMETLMPYYNEIEALSAKAIKEKFGGDVTFSMDTFAQKRFAVYIDDYQFYCFLDGFQETEKTMNVFESKATTNKKFINLGYKEDGEDVSIFGYSPEGVMRLKDELGLPFNTAKFKKARTKLCDRYQACGRYVYDLAFQRFVIEHHLKQTNQAEKAGKTKYYLAVLNSEYVYDGKRDNEGNPLYQNDIIVFIDLTRVTEEMQPQLIEDTQLVINRLDQMNANPTDLGKHCQRNDLRQCPYFEVCWAHIPKKNSILTYLNNHFGFKDSLQMKHERYDLINQGIVHMTDIPYDWLNRVENQIQREVIDTKIPYVDIKKIKTGIQCLKYPIYHLDFETFPCPLPRFAGEKAYAQSLFQFSIHIERSPGQCDKDKDHIEYLAPDHTDRREELLKALLDAIQNDQGTVLVYNQSFEKTRLKEIADIYPHFKDKIEIVIDRLFDLLHLVKYNTKLYEALGYETERAKRINYYHENLNGSYSIKKVLPIFSDLTYEGMAVSHGGEALITYARFPNMKPSEFKKAYHDLIEYCKQDTWAMVLILEGLRQLI